MNIKLTKVAFLAAFFISILSSSTLFAAAPVADATSNSASSRKSGAAETTNTSSTAQAKVSTSSALKLRPDVRLERLERTSDARTQILLNLQNDFNDIASEIAVLSGKIEEHNYQIQQILQRQRDLYQEIERRLSQSAVTDGQDPIRGQSADVATAKVSKPARASVKKGMKSDNKNEDAAYDAAVALVIKKKRYADAIPAFKDFIAKYPKSTYRPNAHYWLGQLLYSQGDKKAALLEFGVLITEYKNSNKRGDSLLKAGVISQSLGDPEQAKKYFQQVLSEYPGSASAKLAQDELNKI